VFHVRRKRAEWFLPFGSHFKTDQKPQIVMENFKEHVTRWIVDSRDTEMLLHIEKFIDNSKQPDEIKRELLFKIQYKRCALNKVPCFVKTTLGVFLASDDGSPRVFSSRLEAVLKMAALKFVGIDVEVEPHYGFAYIKLKQPHSLAADNTVIIKISQ
jgi:hypothetical protein